MSLVHGLNQTIAVEFLHEATLPRPLEPLHKNCLLKALFIFSRVAHVRRYLTADLVQSCRWALYDLSVTPISEQISLALVTLRDAQHHIRKASEAVDQKTYKDDMSAMNDTIDAMVNDLMYIFKATR